MSDLVDSDLISNFVHQVINPLNGVIGSLDNIIDGTTPPGRHPQRLRAIRAQLGHSIELIRNLAYLAQLATEEGMRGLGQKAQSVIIPEVIIEAIQFYQESGLRGDIKIELTDPETQYAVPGHKDLLRQVFMNLFDNAVKYSDSDTAVNVIPRLQKKTGVLLVEVESVGIGFDADERARIFERGYRGAEARGRAASGAGIGLYICRRILEDAHGSTIEALHEVQKRRTVFLIRFPQVRILDPRRRASDDDEQDSIAP